MANSSTALVKFLSRVSVKLGVGEHVYVVGGAVRNFVLGVPPKDYDLVIDSVALNGRDSEWFAKALQHEIPCPSSLVTNNYGVAILTVKGPWSLQGEDMSGEVIEIANARKESYGGTEGKGYKPTDVQPATIMEDVVRREFNFNTLLWRLKDLAEGPDKAEIIDLTGCGLRDIQEGVLRCPRDPDIVFADDPSRLIRVVKFTMKYGFKIPPDVMASIHRNVDKVRNIPSGHLSNMLIETFLREPTAKKALAEMEKLGILEVVRDVARTDKSFRLALSNWADKEASLDLFFHLIDVGMPVGARLRFLSAEQAQRVREITVQMSAIESDRFVAVLHQPGKIIDTLSLMTQFDLKGRDVGRITDVARSLLLRTPALLSAPSRLEDLVRVNLT